MKPSTFVFDAYGTLFDVHAAVRRHLEAVGPDALHLSQIWRAKQLEYTWTRSLMGRYRDFWTLTEEALDFALKSVPSADAAMRQPLLDAYMTLDAYGEVLAVLRELKRQGMRLAILSNGSPKMLHAAVRSAGLETLLDDVFSVDGLRVYKSDRRVYEIVTAAYGLDPAAVSFQSSNRWDIAGATALGFWTVWINRTGQQDEYGDLPPGRVMADLKGLTAQV